MGTAPFGRSARDGLRRRDGGDNTIGAGPPPRPPAVVPGFVGVRERRWDASDPVVAAVRAGRTKAEAFSGPEDLLQEVPDGG